MSDFVTSAQRFTRDRPCPICGGWQRQERGNGKRCHGYLSQDGEYCFCTREDHGGELNDNANLYTHKMYGACRCGSEHNPARESEYEAVYDYALETGTLEFQVVRDFGKKFRQRKPDGAGGWVWKTAGVRRVPYNLPALAAAPIDRAETISFQCLLASVCFPQLRKQNHISNRW